MSSQLRVDNILPSAGTALGIGTASGSITFNSNISGDVIFNDDVTVNGVLTYEDVTNIDSVGVITARSDISIADKIVHTGDTDTAIRFPGADQVSIETGGTQRLLIGSDGKLVHSTSAAETVDFGTSNSSGSYHKYDLGSSGATVGYIGAGSQIVSGSNVADFGIRGQANLVFSSGGDTERLRITSAGTLESYSSNDTTPNIKWRSDDTNWYGALNQSVHGGTITSFLSCGGDWSANGTTYSATKALAAYPTSAIAVHNQYNNSWGSQFVFLTKAGGSTTTDGAVKERVRINSAGNLIIDAGGDAQDIQIISHSANSGHGKIYLRGHASNESSSIQLNHFGHADYHVSAGRAGNGLFSITRTNGGSDGIIMDSAGHLMVGTTTEGFATYGDKLTIADSGHCGMTIRSGTSNYGTIYFSDGDDGTANEVRGFIDYNHSTNTLQLGTDATTRLRISNAGELSISGTKSGNNISDAIIKFNIVNSNGDSKKAEIKANKLSDISSDLIFSTTSSHTFAERMRISEHGRVGVNDSTSGWAEALQVSSLSSQGQYGIAIKIQHNSGYFMRFSNATNICGSVSSSGGNSTSFNTSWSDSRRKKNFESWNEEVLPLFKTLEPKKFNFTDEDDGSEKTKGYVAQDVVNKFPEAYPLLDDTDVNEKRYMFNPSGMTVYLMKALQEEIAKREALEARIAALEG
tara:strand:- start:45 stop:2120 length:2076 start_codon:yes stop_codon:yes gene_type:complete